MGNWSEKEKQPVIVAYSEEAENGEKYESNELDCEVFNLCFVPQPVTYNPVPPENQLVIHTDDGIELHNYFDDKKTDKVFVHFHGNGEIINLYPKLDEITTIPLSIVWFFQFLYIHHICYYDKDFKYFTHKFTFSLKVTSRV